MACAALATGCYAGVQRTTQMATTSTVDPADGDPASDLSFQADIYEIVVGAFYKHAEIFAGAGAGSMRVHQRTATSAMATDEGDATRVHFGASYQLGVAGSFGVRVFGIMASDLNSFYFGDSELMPTDPSLIDSRVSSSKEIGVQITPVLGGNRARYGWYGEPVIRIAGAMQSGQVKPSPSASTPGSDCSDETRSGRLPRRGRRGGLRRQGLAGRRRRDDQHRRRVRSRRRDDRADDRRRLPREGRARHARDLRLHGDHVGDAEDDERDQDRRGLHVQRRDVHAHRTYRCSPRPAGTPPRERPTARARRRDAAPIAA
jgi:hypothetical protein